MMILMSALDWVQSFQGITTISIGGISLSGAAALIIYAVKSASKMKGVGDLVSLVKETKVMLDEEKEQTKFYKESANKKDLEIAKQTEINNLLIKGMSIVVAASGGIDAVSKIDFLNDLKNSKEKIKSLSISSIESIKDISEEKAIELKKEVIEKGTEVLDETIKEVSTLVNKYSKK